MVVSCGSGLVPGRSDRTDHVGRDSMETGSDFEGREEGCRRDEAPVWRLEICRHLDRAARVEAAPSRGVAIRDSYALPHLPLR